MYLGTQIKPRDDSDYRVWAQLGVTHVCVDPPGNPHDWSLDDLIRQREHVEKFGLTLDMVQLPLSSRPIETSRCGSEIFFPLCLPVWTISVCMPSMPSVGHRCFSGKILAYVRGWSRIPIDSANSTRSAG